MLSYVADLRQELRRKKTKTLLKKIKENGVEDV